MILVDTSSWIHMLQPDGDPTVRDRVTAALAAGQACWCPIVQLELWNGARGRHGQNVLREFVNTLPELAINEDVWAHAHKLARRAGARGVTVLASDVLIIRIRHRLDEARPGPGGSRSPGSPPPGPGP